METTGNYLTQRNGDFPLDCETLAGIERNIELCAMLGNILGGAAVLRGCEQGAGEYVSPGWVFLRTRDYPGGEIVEWKGGTGAIFHVEKTDVAVSSGDRTYPKAYVRRSLAAGYGDEQYKWADVLRPRSVAEIDGAARSVERQLQERGLAPLGVVELFAGSNVPQGYALCDGRELRRSEYPELYEVLGNLYNSAADWQGNAYTTGAEMFRLPDLRGRFIVGFNPTDNEYKGMGMTGGEKRHTLEASELPEHSHRIKDYVLIPHGAGETYTGNAVIGGEEMKCGADSTDGTLPKRSDTANSANDPIQWVEHSSGNAGSGEQHENRPPYYTLAYIIRLK